MVDDGYRLSFSINDTGYSIVDNLSGKAVINVRGNITLFTLDKDVVLQHIKNLQEALLTYKVKSSKFSKEKFIDGNTAQLMIRENEHYDWSLRFMDIGINIHNHTCFLQKKIDVAEVLRALNKVYSDLLSRNVVLNPKRDIVRRVVDAGLLFWVHKGSSVVVYENNVQGNYMVNCMVNGIFFNVLIVSACRKTNSVTLFNSNLEEVITFPLDDSILTYYTCDDELFD